MGAVPLSVRIRQGRHSEVRQNKVEDEEGKEEARKASLKKKGYNTLAKEDTDW